MKTNTNLLKLAFSVAFALTCAQSPAMVNLDDQAPGRDGKSIKVKAPENLEQAGEARQGAKKDGENNPELFGKALRALTKAGDKKALAIAKRAAENGGQVTVSKKESSELIKRAREQGLLGDDDAKKDGENNEELFGKALRALTKAGDEKALAIAKRAAENGGEVTVSKKESSELIKRAREQGLLEDPADKKADEALDSELVSKAVQVLAKDGNKAAIRILNEAKQNDGKLKISKSQAARLIKRARKKGLLGDDEGDKE